MYDYYRIEKAIKYISENYKSQPDLDKVAAELNLSPYYFQKMFTEWAGISPKKFVQVLTLEHTKQLLKESTTISATYDAGLSSTSRLHDLFVNIEAMTPAEYKSLGQKITITYGVHDTQFGNALIGITEKGICILEFLDEEELSADALEQRIHSRWPNAKLINDQQKTLDIIQKIFKGNKATKLNLLVKGTNFQIQVWKALLSIPEGQLTTYAQIAKQTESPKALRAVGTAIGANPISFVIPCHRVINKLGIIGNYRWGPDRKRAILAWESAKKA
jgi:AraC family transcriptional regulator of adaptative response/methylated-DNA-[protein]-cysteine methyltransferase